MEAELLKAEKDGNAVKITAIIYDTPAVMDRIVKLSGKEVNITLAEPKEKRSLDSNSYFWLLVNKLADKLHTSKDEMYLKLLKDYGQCVVVTVKQGTNLDRAGFKYYEVFKDGLINGKPFTAYKIFIGSSQYDKAQMRELIDGTVQECKELGIETELEQYVDLMA